MLRHVVPCACCKSVPSHSYEICSILIHVTSRNSSRTKTRHFTQFITHQDSSYNHILAIHAVNIHFTQIIRHQHSSSNHIPAIHAVNSSLHAIHQAPTLIVQSHTCYTRSKLVTTRHLFDRNSIQSINSLRKPIRRYISMSKLSRHLLSTVSVL
jgi:hypothetical protein